MRAVPPPRRGPTDEHPDEPANPYAPPRAPIDRPALRRPLWVRIGLWGIRTRGTARAFCWTCLASSPVGFLIGRAFGVGLFVGLLASAAWYAAAIRWMDRRRAW